MRCDRFAPRKVHAPPVSDWLFRKKCCMRSTAGYRPAAPAHAHSPPSVAPQRGRGDLDHAREGHALALLDRERVDHCARHGRRERATMRGGACRSSDREQRDCPSLKTTSAASCEAVHSGERPVRYGARASACGSGMRIGMRAMNSSKTMIVIRKGYDNLECALWAALLSFVIYFGVCIAPQSAGDGAPCRGRSRLHGGRGEQGVLRKMGDDTGRARSRALHHGPARPSPQDRTGACRSGEHLLSRLQFRPRPRPHVDAAPHRGSDLADRA